MKLSPKVRTKMIVYTIINSYIVIKNITTYKIKDKQ